MENENNNLLISSINNNNTSINSVYNNTSNPYCTVLLSGNKSQIISNNVWYDNDTSNPYYNSGTPLNIVPSQMWYKDVDYQHIQIKTQEKLDSIDIKEIEKYLRQKKLDNINKK